MGQALSATPPRFNRVTMEVLCKLQVYRAAGTLLPAVLWGQGVGLLTVPREGPAAV
jgi:hypothetical protein